MSLVYDRDAYHGYIDSSYHRYPFFSHRAKMLDERFSQYRDSRVLIAGCGWGYLLDELEKLGWERVYGFDASGYAVHEAAVRELPAPVSSRVFHHDITVGPPHGDAYSLIVTENVLPCAEDEAEALLMVENLKRRLEVSGEMVHIITPALDRVRQMSTFLWMTRDWWESTLSDDHIIFTDERH